MPLINPPSLDIAALFALWKKVGHLPGAKLLFSKLVGKVAPYTGTIDARIQELRPRYSRLVMCDRPLIRNHLSSVHALALANFAEEATGLAMLAGFPPGTRGIITRLDIEYLKKARGTLTAECHAPEVATNAPAEYQVETDIKSSRGDVVARATITWRVGPG